ncbi:uncharacterized protein LOC111629018 [Centruroides sculpturatus]|uniref:uncharacterized protein LOC111629018 n=1 Tax=Centruroides sculpturatus TaxID=218467 RepID=UPI000C6D0A1A|nr:uncharacterized protein LOC111629018 [Centruroides sculpturatus]
MSPLSLTSYTSAQLLQELDKRKASIIPIAVKRSSYEIYYSLKYCRLGTDVKKAGRPISAFDRKHDFAYGTRSKKTANIDERFIRCCDRRDTGLLGTIAKLPFRAKQAIDKLIYNTDRHFRPHVAGTREQPYPGEKTPDSETPGIETRGDHHNPTKPHKRTGRELHSNPQAAKKLHLPSSTAKETASAASAPTAVSEGVVPADDNGGGPIVQQMVQLPKGPKRITFDFARIFKHCILLPVIYIRTKNNRRSGHA